MRANDEDAIKTVESGSEEFDLILMDIDLGPGKVGTEAAGTMGWVLPRAPRRTWNPQGAGMGMTIVHILVEQIGARFFIESEQGTRIKIILPIGNPL